MENRTRLAPDDGCLKQVGVDSLGRSIERTVLAGAVADAHHCRARILHDGADVGKVEVNETRNGDQVGNALNALTQRIVGDAERIEHGGLLVDDFEESVVGDDDERIHLLGEQIAALLCLIATQTTFETERLGDDADRKSADFLACNFRDNGSSTRARATAFASGHEDHIGLGQCLANLAPDSSAAWQPYLGICAGAEAARQFLADVNGLIGGGKQKSLLVGVHGNELHALQSGLDHAIDGVRSAAADTYDLDDGQVLRTNSFRHHILHACYISSCVCLHRFLFKRYIKPF